MSNYADSGIKIRATGFKQVTASTSKTTSTPETKDFLNQNNSEFRS